MSDQQEAEKEPRGASTVPCSRTPRTHHRQGDLRFCAGGDGAAEGTWRPCQQGAQHHLLYGKAEMPTLRKEPDPRFSSDIALEVPHSFEEMLSIADRNGTLFAYTKKNYKRLHLREKKTNAVENESSRIERIQKRRDRKEYYRANKARIKEKRHAYYIANRDRIIAASEEYYYAHREEISAINKEYYDAYHDYVLLKDKRRREEEASR